MSAEGAQESQNPSDVGSGEVQIPKPQFQQQTGITAAWLAQLVERQSAVREFEGSSPRPGLKITEENVLPL